MSYNLHPLFVHFPIALLLMYSLIKIIPFQKWVPQIAWVDVRRISLLAGSLGAMVALYTGEIAEHLIKPNHPIVEAHSTFATTATWLYVALLLGELSAFLLSNDKFTGYISNGASASGSKRTLSKILSFFKIVFHDGVFSKILALVGLVLVTVTGVLGGVTVHGIGGDPIAPIILNILGIRY